MAKQTTQDMIPPITIPFFNTGYFTRRSQLFAPFRSLGVNIVSYHDALLGGQDMEVTDLMELQRRPGYSRFCSVQLASNEIINQFYSSRSMTGAVNSFYDSSLYWSIFTPSSITHLLTKNTTAQGYIQQISDKTYYQNGVDAVQWDGTNVRSWGIEAPASAPTLAGTGFWLANSSYTAGKTILDTNGNIEHVITSGTSGRVVPSWPTQFNAIIYDGLSTKWRNLGTVGSWYASTQYPTDSVILDSNGNLQEATDIVETRSAIITGFEEVSDLSGYWIWTSVSDFQVGQQLKITGFSGEGAALNNTTSEVLQVLGFNTHTGGDGFSATGYQYKVTNQISSAYSGNVGVDTGLATPIVGFVSSSGSVEPTWNAAVAGTTSDGNITWTNIGPGSQIASTGYAWRYAYRTIYGHLSTSSPDTPSTGPILGPSLANITSFAINGSNVVTITCANGHGYVAGNHVYINNMSTATYLNNQVFTVLSSGLTATVFKFAFTHTTVGTTSDSGTAQLAPAQITGLGTGNALCSSTATITNVVITGNVITFTASNHFVPGLAVNISGLSSATQLNGWQFIVVSASDPTNALATVNTQFTAYVMPNMPFYGSNYASHSDSGTATFCAIEIYRTADGGGLFYFAAAVVNPGSGSTWTFSDYIPDEQLDAEVIAPIAHLNDPPPGQTGSLVNQGGTLVTYWQGRMWMVVGNRVYFDGGPDVINGIPYESWPPANVFAYPGPVQFLAPTSEGMLVFLSDRVDIILGGPQTYSFYSQDLLKNFGVSSPNCVSQDGDTVYCLTTQGQLFILSMQGKQELGSYVADVIEETFSPASSYLTVHRNGLDAGVFLSDGAINILRFGINIGAWSLMAKPVGGIGAINSIETSTSTYTLCAARQTGGGYILARNLSVWQDDSQDYTLCQATIGSITLSQPGAPLVPVQHIVGYFDAAGTLTGGNASIPRMEIMPNEISTSVGVGFLTLPETVPEPPTGQTIPSRSLQQLRWPVNMVNSTLISQLMHHLQIRITFAPENAPNTVKALSIKSDQD